MFIVGLAIHDRFSPTFIFLHQELWFSARLLFCPGEEFMHSCLLINFSPLEAIFLVLILPHVPQISAPTVKALKSLTKWYTKSHCQTVKTATNNLQSNLQSHKNESLSQWKSSLATSLSKGMQHRMCTRNLTSFPSSKGPCSWVLAFLGARLYFHSTSC